MNLLKEKLIIAFSFKTLFLISSFSIKSNILEINPKISFFPIFSRMFSSNLFK